MTNADHPRTPFTGFPLWPHARGDWAKKTRGKTDCFGRIEDGWEAIEGLFHSYLEAAKTNVANGGEFKQSQDSY